VTCSGGSAARQSTQARPVQSGQELQTNSAGWASGAALGAACWCCPLRGRAQLHSTRLGLTANTQRWCGHSRRTCPHDCLIALSQVLRSGDRSDYERVLAMSPDFAGSSPTAGPSVGAGEGLTTSRSGSASRCCRRNLRRSRCARPPADSAGARVRYSADKGPVGELRQCGALCYGRPRSFISDCHPELRLLDISRMRFTQDCSRSLRPLA